MSGLHFETTLENANFNQKLEEIKKGVREASKLIEQEGSRIDAINQKFESFDEEVLKMCGNLNKYFDGLLSKVESMASMLQVGKVELSAPTIKSDGTSTQQLEELRSRNAELTAELEKQRAEIKHQQEEWNKLATAIKSNNVSAVEQYKQATASSTNAVKDAKLELKGLSKELDDNLKYYDKLAVQAAAYKEELVKLQDAQAKGIARVVTGANGTSMPVNDEIDRLKNSLSEVRENQKGVSQEITAQRQRQVELNTVIEQGNEKHVRTRTLIMDAREQMIQMRTAGLQNTIQYQQAGEELGKMRLQMKLVNAEMEFLANPNKGIATLKAGLSGAATSASLLVGIMGLFNDKSEKMAELQTKIQSLMAVVVGLEGTYGMLKKSNTMMLAIENVRRKATIASMALEAKAKEGNIALTWSEVAAQKALNIVAKANPYVILITALLSVVGGIALFVSATKNSTKEQEKALQSTLDLISAKNQLALANKSAVSNSIKERAELDLLYKRLKDTTLGTEERNAAVSEWVRKNPQHSNIMKGELVDLGKLDLAYQSLSKQIIESAKARAYTDSITELETKKNDTLLKRQNQYVTYLKAIEKYNKAKEVYDKSPGQRNQIRYEQASSLLQKEKKAWENLVKETNAYDKSISIISKNIKVGDLFTQPEKGTYDYWQQQVQIADGALKQIKDTYLKVLQSGDKEKIKLIPDDVVKQYNTLTKQKTEAEKALKVYDSSSKRDDQDHKLREEQEKYKLLLDKQSREQQRMKEDAANELEQLEINKLIESSDKVLKQRELNHRLELQAIKREAEDKKLKVIEDARSAFEANPENKKRIFNTENFIKSEPTKILFSSFDNTAKEKTKTENIKYNRGDDLISILEKYRNFNQQRLKLEKEYQEDEKILQDRMLKAKTEDEKKEIQELMVELAKRRKKGMQEISKNEIEDSGIWKQLMGDVDALPTDALEKLLSDAEQLVKVTNLSATDMKAMMDTINNARQNLIMRNPFKTLKEEYEKYQKAVRKGDKQGASTAWSNVEQASESIKNNLSILGTSLASLGKTFSDEFGEGIQKAVDIISDGITAFEVFGKTGEKSAGDTVKGISGIIGIITTLIGTVMNAFDTTAEEQARNIEYQRRQEGYWDSINYQVERYLELLKEATANDYFDIATKSLTTLESARKKAYQDIVKSLPSGDVDGTTFGLYQLLRTGKFFDPITEHSKGGQTAKEILDFINANGGYDLENKLISEEAIWAMKSNSDIWSKLPEWMQQAIDKFVEFNDQAKELEGTLNEDLFQTTSQGLEDAILEGLKGGKRGIDDFGEEFEEIMRNALLQSFVIDQLRGKAQEFYKRYTLLADSDKDGKLDLTKDEIKDLRESWNDIIKAATEEAKKIDSIIGSSESSREASKKGFASMSQDSADKLDGSFAVMTSHTYSINEEVKSINSGTEKIVEKLSYLINMDKNMSEMLRCNDTIVSHLSDISNYTSNLVEIREFMYAVKLGIDTLNTKGITLKR